jgi:hypothetical protein
MTVRDALLPLLDAPRCARQLRERSGCKRKAVETAIKRMADQRLVQCITPGLRQSRLYVLTPLGRLIVHEMTGHSVPDLPDLPWPLYAWIQAGTYRRLVLRHLAHPMSPKSLRMSIVAEHKQVGANHVHTVLRDFAQRGIARNDGRTWSLSPLGEAFRRIDSQGSVEGPAIRAPLWTSAESPRQENDQDRND